VKIFIDPIHDKQLSLKQDKCCFTGSTFLGQLFFINRNYLFSFIFLLLQKGNRNERLRKKRAPKSPPERTGRDYGPISGLFPDLTFVLL